ncbi:hypothetical protein QTO34_002394, partial [Cnephaeus nilssonii]
MAEPLVPMNYPLNPQIQRIDNTGRKAGPRESVAPLHVIYPSAENVQSSLEGNPAGSSLPYRIQTAETQNWLHSYFHKWSAKTPGCSNAMPILRLTRDPSDCLVPCHKRASVQGRLGSVRENPRPDDDRLLGAQGPFPLSAFGLDSFRVRQKVFSSSQEPAASFPVPCDLPPELYGSKDQHGFGTFLISKPQIHSGTCGSRPECYHVSPDILEDGSGSVTQFWPMRHKQISDGKKEKHLKRIYFSEKKALVAVSAKGRLNGLFLSGLCHLCYQDYSNYDIPDFNAWHPPQLSEEEPQLKRLALLRPALGRRWWRNLGWPIAWLLAPVFRQQQFSSGHPPDLSASHRSSSRGWTSASPARLPLICFGVPRPPGTGHRRLKLPRSDKAPQTYITRAKPRVIVMELGLKPFLATERLEEQIYDFIFPIVG